MANIFILPADVILYILRYLDIHDRIAFALTCRKFRQICVDAKVFRKMDFSRRAISRTQRSQISKFIMDRQLTEQITELNVSNLRVLNWQMEDPLIKEFIPKCHNLEALHVLSCGLSLRRLHHILKEAPKLTDLSWSLWDFTFDDMHFLSTSFNLSEGLCLRNIKHSHLDMNESKSHTLIGKYLVLACFRELQELEIRIWSTYSTGWNLPVATDQMILYFPWPSDENKLQHLCNLLVVPVGGPFSVHRPTDEMLSDFVISVLSWKSSSLKWKNLWILPSVTFGRVDWSLVLDSVHQDDFQSLEAIAANPNQSDNAVNKLKSFFERIGDNTVHSLHLYLPNHSNRIVEFCDPILRVGGHSLKFLYLSVDFGEEIPAEQNVFIQSLCSNCVNITELDLLDCYFEKNICEHLSKLRILTKVQLKHCAISSKHYRGNELQISKENLLTFVENCQNITHLDIRGGCDYEQFSCLLTDDDLLALAKFRKLKSLTLYNVSGLTEWTFLQNISENCKFLTMLRITAWETFRNSHIPILKELARFLKHLAFDVDVPVLESVVFWKLLRHAKNLERLCIRSCDEESLNVPVAVEALKSLPQLHVLHMHSLDKVENVQDFYDQMTIMLEEKESVHRFSFEIVMGNRISTWINHETGYTLISDKALFLNNVELCQMEPFLRIPRL